MPWKFYVGLGSVRVIVASIMQCENTSMGYGRYSFLIHSILNHQYKNGSKHLKKNSFIYIYVTYVCNCRFISPFEEIKGSLCSAVELEDLECPET